MPLGLSTDKTSIRCTFQHTHTKVKGNGFFVLTQRMDAYNIDTYVSLFFKQLLQFLQEFSQQTISTTHEIKKQVDGLIRETKATDCRLHNVFNDFLMLSNTQFIENVSYLVTSGLKMLFRSPRVIVILCDLLLICLINFDGSGSW